MTIVIVISGVPGVGKSIVATRLAKKLKAKVISLSKFIIDNKLYESYDNERKTYIIDEEKTIAKIKELIEGCRDEYLIIEGHYGEIVPKEYVSFFFVLRLHPLILYERLKEREWDERKIKENVAAEILSVPTANAINVLGKHRICEINVTNMDLDDVVNKILKIIKHGHCEKKEFIDWTTIIDFKLLEKFLI